MKNPHFKKEKIFLLTQLDRKIYTEQIEKFLPEEIIDIHAHIWPRGLHKSKIYTSRTVSWPEKVARFHPVSHLLETYRLLFPGKKLTALIFGNVPTLRTLNSWNRYVCQASRETGFPALVFSSPRWSGKKLEQEIRRGNFIGAKSYLSLAPSCLKTEEIRIFDFFPLPQLEVVNRHGWILMLHLPRPLRLKDPLNLKQLVEIDKNFPRMKTIVAHVGRAYCNQDIGSAFRILKKTKNLFFDISANTNEWVFGKLIEAVGPERLLFGSDLPITRMRMKRICEKGVYINLIPPGLYGDVSNDPHLRELPEEQAKSLTFFLYEEILAFLNAAKTKGLTRKDIKKVFYDNALRVIEQAKSYPKKQLQMLWPSGKTSFPWVDLPAGYTLRTFRRKDRGKYIQLMRKAGFTGWNQVETVLQKALPEGIFFVEDSQGNLVATACCLHNPTRFHPSGGELGWVAVDPDHRGKGLGLVVCQEAVRRFLGAGYRRIYLLTDDWRLPAIKTYWKLGFIPFLYNSEMKERWQKVIKKLGLS